MRRSQIVLQIHKDLISGKIFLPALPRVALQIKHIASKEGVDTRQLSMVAQADSAFCGYLLQVSNSPLIRGSVPIKTVWDAINRLGLKSLKNLAMTFAMRAVFRPKSKTIAKQLQQVWQQSTYTAALAQIMAKRSQTIDPEQALLAGLMQNIGMLPLLYKAANYADLVHSEAGLKAIEYHYAANIGTVVLKKWKMEPEFLEVARHRSNWMRTHNHPADLTDLLILARLHSFVGTAEMKNLPRINEIPAFSKLDLGELGPEQSFQFIKDAKQEIQQIQLALSGGAN